MPGRQQPRALGRAGRGGSATSSAGRVTSARSPRISASRPSDVADEPLQRRRAAADRVGDGRLRRLDRREHAAQLLARAGELGRRRRIGGQVGVRHDGRADRQRDRPADPAVRPCRRRARSSRRRRRRRRAARRARRAASRSRRRRPAAPRRRASRISSRAPQAASIAAASAVAVDRLAHRGRRDDAQRRDAELVGEPHLARDDARRPPRSSPARPRSRRPSRRPSWVNARSESSSCRRVPLACATSSRVVFEPISMQAQQGT